jgi:hypothetical protein
VRGQLIRAKNGTAQNFPSLALRKTKVSARITPCGLPKPRRPFSDRISSKLSILYWSPTNSEIRTIFCWSSIRCCAIPIAPDDCPAIKNPQSLRPAKFPKRVSFPPIHIQRCGCAAETQNPQTISRSFENANGLDKGDRNRVVCPHSSVN